MYRKIPLWLIGAFPVILFFVCCSTAPDDEPENIPLDGRGGGIIVYCYQPSTGGIHQIYGINADGTGDRKLIDAPIGLNHHDVSPDGQKVVAVGYVDQATWSIHVFNFDGSGLTRLTATANVLDSEPAWSPDGSRIAFTRIYPDQNFRNEIWIMDADGSNLQRTGIEGYGARWSLDGTRFIFTNTGNWGASGLKGSDIYTSRIDGSDIRQLSSTAGDEWYASWSADGSRIVFSYTVDGIYAHNEIYAMNADGTGRSQLTSNTVCDDGPRWSPDGSRIAFISDLAAAEQWEVYIMNADGGNVRRVTNSPSGSTAINPAWVPGF